MGLVVFFDDVWVVSIVIKTITDKMNFRFAKSECCAFDKWCLVGFKPAPYDCGTTDISRKLVYLF